MDGGGGRIEGNGGIDEMEGIVDGLMHWECMYG